MTEPDVIDDSARHAADRRDDRRGAIVASVAIVAVLLVGGLVNLGTALQSGSPTQLMDAEPSPVSTVELPTFSLPDEAPTPVPTPTYTRQPKAKHL